MLIPHKHWAEAKYREVKRKKTFFFAKERKKKFNNFRHWFNNFRHYFHMQK